MAPECAYLPRACTSPLVEVGGRAVVFLEQLAVDFHGLAGRLFMAGKQGADHDHGGAKADALGNVTVAADRRRQ